MTSLLSRRTTAVTVPRDPQYDLAGSAEAAQNLAVDNANFKIAQHSTAIDPHGDRAWTSASFVPLSFFDGDGKLATSRIPSLGLVDVFPVNSEAAMLGLNVQRGDIAIRTEQGATYILQGDNPSVLSNWVLLPGAGKVISVNGQQGAVVLSSADVAAAPLIHGGRHRPGDEDDISAQYIGWHMKGVANGVESYGAAAAAQSAAATDASNKMSSHLAAADPHNAQARVNAHATASDPHGDRADSTSKINNHATANDPHGDRADASSKIAAHSTASDPHGDRAWVTSTYAARMLPAGGTSGQVLGKNSGTNYDVGWITPAAGGGGGSASTIESVNTVSASGTAQTLPDVTTATIHDVTLTANCTFTFPTAAAGKSFALILRQDGTGGRGVTWPAVLWPSGAAPTRTTGANAVDVLTFISLNNSWSGAISAKDLR